MARQLWLLRHGDAEPHGTRPDSDRRLTERGIAQSRAAGIALRELGVEFELILYSPKVRAQQTAEVAAEAWSEQQRACMSSYPPLAGGFGGVEAFDALAGLDADGRLLLVGHEPDLSDTVAALGGGRIDMKKGGVAALRLDGATGELVVLLRPRELALIAGVPGGGQ
jgi:phosphohistidine phosphatase